ncbi:MAG: dockerin type I repeat-containing protein, partial [Phocaeicola sp.]
FIALYDAESLQLISSEAGSAVSSIGSATIDAGVSGKVVYSWNSDAAASVNGDVLNLRFKVLQAEKPEALIRFESEEGSQSVCTVWTDGTQTSMNCETITGRITFLSILLGDVNGDGSVNVIDANMVRRAAAKLIVLSDTQKLAADVNNDGKINIVDANLIRRYAAKLIDTFVS